MLVIRYFNQSSLITSMVVIFTQTLLTMSLNVSAVGTRNTEHVATWRKSFVCPTFLISKGAGKHRGVSKPESLSMIS